MDLNIKASTDDWRLRLTNGDVSNYAIIGDSISIRKNTYVWFLRDILESQFGNAGDGYLALGIGFRHVNDGSRNTRPGLSFSNSSEWSERSTVSRDRSELGRRTIDGIYSRIAASGWIEVEIFGPEATLHYVKEVGAGIIRIQVEGVEVAQVDASLESGNPELGLYTFSTSQVDLNVSTTVRFSLAGADEKNPQWTQLNGLQMTTGQPGVAFSRLARGGVPPEDFLLTDPQIFHDQLSALEPGLVIVMIDSGDLPIYETSMNTLLDQISNAVPDAEIILASHHHFRENRGDLADILINIANERFYGFLNLFDLHESNEHLQELDFLDDEVHFNALGGEWFAKFYLNALFGWTIPTDITVDFGFLVEGNIYETRGSDDDWLRTHSKRLSFIEPNVLTYTAKFVTDVLQPQTIDLKAEWRIDAISGTADFQLLNHQSGQFETIDKLAVGPTEKVMIFDSIDASSYVHPDSGEVQLRIRTVSFATYSLFGFDAYIDHLQIRVN